MPLEPPLPHHPCPAPPSPATTVNLLFAIPTRRVVPLFRRSREQRAESMMRRWNVLRGMLSLLSSCLPPARASVLEGGVSEANLYVGGGWVENEGWKPCEGIRASNGGCPLKLKTRGRWGRELRDFGLCTPARHESSREGEHTSPSQSDGQVASSPSNDNFPEFPVFLPNRTTHVVEKNTLFW